MSSEAKYRWAERDRLDAIDVLLSGYKPPIADELREAIVERLVPRYAGRDDKLILGLGRIKPTGHLPEAVAWLDEHTIVQSAVHKKDVYIPKLPELERLLASCVSAFTRPR